VSKGWAFALLAACSASKHSQPATPPDPDASIDSTVVTGTTCSGSAQPLDADWMIDVGGTQRLAHVHVPASYDPTKPTPVVIDLHGRTSNGTQQAWLSHMVTKSDAAGFIVVHPESSTSPTSWNSGAGCCDPAYSNHVDDVGFMNNLLDQLEAKLCVDADRVYTTGLSNGGYLSHTLACDLSDRIAAIGSVAGLLQVDQCNATRAMPVFDVHGDNDPIVSYSWVPQTIDFWTQHNGCTTMTTTYQNGNATCVTHGGCTSGADVVLCTIAGGGHQWPGGEALPFLGLKSDDLNATDAQWEFFVAHPR
jgi:polyhydroxybutyrate depolymerase